MTCRRSICRLLLAPFAMANLSAATRQQVLQLVTPLAAALSDGDAGAFMAHIPADVEERAALAVNVDGLLAAARVTSSVNVIEFGENEARLDWYIEIQSRATGTVVERRRQPVIVRFKDEHLTAIQPVRFFRPPAMPARQ